MSYVDEIYEKVVAQSLGGLGFYQAVKGVLNSLKLVIDANKEKYRREGILKRSAEPERVIPFRVPWIDDNGAVQINRGYKVQFNNATGPYKDGLCFHPPINQSTSKFLGFERTFRDFLAGPPMGGGKGGSDFDPRGKSDREVMALCQSFMTELYRHIGRGMDTPAGDIGVGDREIEHLSGQYKRITGSYEGTLTGKGLTFGGSLARTQTTRYGLIHILNEMLKYNGKDTTDKIVVASGPDNVAIHATERAQQLGAKVVVLSDSSGYIYDKEGTQLDIVKEVKEVRRGHTKEYMDEVPTMVYTEGRGIQSISCNIALPCATQSELNPNDAQTLLADGCFAVVEGTNMPSTREATGPFVERKILSMPDKVANAGGMATPGLEQSQNSSKISWSFEEVDDEFHTIMVNTFARVSEAAERYGVADNYVASANTAGSGKAVEVMLRQGIV